MTRREKAIMRLETAIGRIEAAQNSGDLSAILQEAGLHHEINSAKSKLIAVLNRLERE
jgi:hypothetical protein